MIITAAESLSELLTEEDIKKKKIFPDISHIRDCSVHIAAKVMIQAYREGHLNNKKAR